MSREFIELGTRTPAPTCGPACTGAGGCTCGQTASWAPAACTLDEADRPAREQEFASLFASAVRSAQRPNPTTLHLVLDPAFAAEARDLAARESGCCSFFEFAFTDAPTGLAWSISVPADQVQVLDALETAAR